MRGKNGLPLFASNWIDGELVREMFRIWHPFRVRCDGGRLPGVVVAMLLDPGLRSVIPSGWIVVVTLLDPGLRSLSLQDGL